MTTTVRYNTAGPSFVDLLGADGQLLRRVEIDGEGEFEVGDDVRFLDYGRSVPSVTAVLVAVDAQQPPA